MWHVSGIVSIPLAGWLSIEADEVWDLVSSSTSNGRVSGTFGKKENHELPSPNILKVSLADHKHICHAVHVELVSCILTLITLCIELHYNLIFYCNLLKSDFTAFTPSPLFIAPKSSEAIQCPHTFDGLS